MGWCSRCGLCWSSIKSKWICCLLLLRWCLWLLIFSWKTEVESSIVSRSCLSRCLRLLLLLGLITAHDPIEGGAKGIRATNFLWCCRSIDRRACRVLVRMLKLHLLLLLLNPTVCKWINHIDYFSILNFLNLTN